MSKREKITFESINGLNFKTVDMEQYWKDQKLREAQELKKYTKDCEAERKRRDRLHCPVCKSSKKKTFFASEHNGIIGPGSFSHITQEYLICLDCGVLYSDLKKKNIEKPFSMSGKRLF